MNIEGNIVIRLVRDIRIFVSKRKVASRSNVKS